VERSRPDRLAHRLEQFLAGAWLGQHSLLTPRRRVAPPDPARPRRKRAGRSSIGAAYSAGADERLRPAADFPSCGRPASAGSAGPSRDSTGTTARRYVNPQSNVSIDTRPRHLARIRRVSGDTIVQSTGCRASGVMGSWRNHF
jgi:hypothetical protein